jgi:hypothetical protein
MSIEISEKIGVLAAKADAAHSRLDKLEIGLREDLKEIKKDLKELNGYMHRGKGWAAAIILLSGFAGAGVVKLLGMMFSN